MDITPKNIKQTRIKQKVKLASHIRQIIQNTSFILKIKLKLNALNMIKLLKTYILFIKN